MSGIDLPKIEAKHAGMCAPGGVPCGHFDALVEEVERLRAALDQLAPAVEPGPVELPDIDAMAADLPRFVTVLPRKTYTPDDADTLARQYLEEGFRKGAAAALLAVQGPMIYDALRAKVRAAVAAPGTAEPVCGAVDPDPQYPPTPCQLITGHDGWHEFRQGGAFVRWDNPSAPPSVSGTAQTENPNGLSLSRCAFANDPNHKPHEFTAIGAWPRGVPDRWCVGGPAQDPTAQTEATGCGACGKPVDPNGPHLRHQRLGVLIHSGCDLTDVCGEDVTGHTLLWCNYRPAPAVDPLDELADAAFGPIASEGDQ